MKILAVCSFGVGSSLILKLTIDKAFARLRVSGESENIDVSLARGTPCDGIFTSAELAETLGESVGVPVIPIKRYMDVNEVEAAVVRLQNILKEGE